ncbi:MAG: YhbY family RNA-binding protein [Candidatus Nanoarchaeia archaeon]
MNIQEENAVTLQLGKKGVGESFYEEIIKNLKQNRLVKVKMLKNSMEIGDKNTYSEQIIEEISKKLKIETKLVGKTLFLKRINQQ